MATIYKIHPAIGVARVGNAEQEFFLGPETAGSPGVEIGTNGAETPVRQYKHNGRVKRQGARFRVFAYEQDAAGRLELKGEVGDGARIDWTVNLVNRKAALTRHVRPAAPRNIGVADRNSLIVRGPAPTTVGGTAQRSPEISGSFLGKRVFLGELRTDSRGRLIVLGGRGISGSVPPNRPLHTFANNDLWFDDVADGPVTATVSIPGQAPVVVHEPAWVVVAPPDFAPSVAAMVSLYDVAFQAAVDKGALHPAPRPVFVRDIKPLIERMVDMRWVDDWDEWNPLVPLNLAALGDPSPANAQRRRKMAEHIENPELNMFELPTFLHRYVEQWAAGDFDTSPQAPVRAVPDELDYQALVHCSGNNFFPGIEAGQNLKDRDIYSRPFRLDHTNAGKVYPGCLTEIMALPWQADFLACTGNWWPTQRPDFVMTRADRIPRAEAWADPMGVFEDMVENSMRLGFVVPKQHEGETVLVEADRDPTYRRNSVAAVPEPNPV